MRTLVITPPGPLFNIQTLREQVRIDAIGDAHPDDALLLRQAAAARAHAELHTGLAIGEQTREVAGNSFWDLVNHSLPGGRPDLVEAFEYRSLGTAAWTAVDAGVFYYDAYDGALRFWAGAIVPTLPDIYNAARIRYVVGTDVPVDVRAAVLLITADLYLNRETSAPADLRPLPLGARELLAPHRLELGV